MKRIMRPHCPYQQAGRSLAPPVTTAADNPRTCRTQCPRSPHTSSSAACGRNQVEGFAWPRAVSVQLSALSLAFSVQLLNQHREHAFDISSIARTIPKSRAPRSAGSFADSMLIASSPRFREPASGGLLLTAAALWVLRSIFESSISHEPIPGLPYDLELLLCNMQRSHGERVYPLAALQHVRFFVMARANVQVL